MNKPNKPKPHFYACCFPEMQEIAKNLGYNLIVHGSMNRDLDMIAVPWVDDPKSHIELLQEIDKYLRGGFYDTVEGYMPSILPGGRSSYVINIERGGKYNGYADPQFYIDLSITPLK